MKARVEKVYVLGWNKSSEQMAKHDKIVHHLWGLYFDPQTIISTHNFTNQIISAILLLNHRAYDTLQSNFLSKTIAITTTR